MKHTKALASLALAAATLPGIAAQTAASASYTDDAIVPRVAPSVGLVVTGSLNDLRIGVGPALVVRSEGVLLTAYHVFKDAHEAQVRLKSGDTYDKVELLAWDERRDVAAVRISAVGLPVLPVAPLTEVVAGQAVYVLSTGGAPPWAASRGVVRAVRAADEVPGAGSGYRLIQFTAAASPGSSGGVLVDLKGRVLGLVVGAANGQNLDFAVPIEGVLGLAETRSGRMLASGASLSLPEKMSSATSTAGSTTPTAPASSSRPSGDRIALGVAGTALSAAVGSPLPSLLASSTPATTSSSPETQVTTAPSPQLSDNERSEMLASRDPKKILCAFRTIFIDPKTIWMTSEMLENALQKQPEFQTWQLKLVRDPRLADVRIEVRVPAFTFNYHYTALHQNTSIVLSAGKVHATTGLGAAPGIAKAFVNDIKKAGRPLPSKEPAKKEEKKSGDKANSESGQS